MLTDIARCPHGSLLALEAPVGTRLAIPTLELQFPCGCSLRGGGVGGTVDAPVRYPFARKAVDYTPRAKHTFAA